MNKIRCPVNTVTVLHIIFSIGFTRFTDLVSLQVGAIGSLVSLGTRALYQARSL